jgi:hypothetical protein
VLALVVVLVLYISAPSQTFSFSLLRPAALRPPTSTRDSANRLLSADQCVQRYPDLYFEADRAKAWYAAHGGITAEAVDLAEKEGGNARLTIIDNHVRLSMHCSDAYSRQLYVKADNGGINSRTRASIATVYATLLTSPEPMPDVE